MKPLPLSGNAKILRGVSEPLQRQVLRLRSLDSDLGRSIDAHDAAIVRDANDAGVAIRNGFTSAVCIGVAAENMEGISNALLLSEEFGYLNDGDVIGFDPESLRFRVNYRRASKHNAFLVTERCNHYCLMCSQPPKNIDDSWILDEIEECIPLVDPGTETLGFTGGEPLLQWQRFTSILKKTRDLLPSTSVHVLTNGRGFSSDEVASAWANIGHPRLCAGIPIYAAVDHIHDYVVQARGAFDDTVLGILRLKDKGQRIEVRIVLQRISALRIVETCTWLARNLPFVDHVALMGLENTGFTLANEDLLWIDPVDYQEQLAEAVSILVAAGLNTSVYNLPLCLLDRSVWPLAVQSISDWKNSHLPECEICQSRSSCAGFFTTGRLRKSRGIKPFT
jgi:His-Xaa-Ser system radical SAM maturase HxsC